MPDNSNYQFNQVPGGLIEYVKDKSKSSKSYFRYLLARTTKMFSYKNLPDTIPEHILERYLQVNGIACITEYNGDLYVFNGSLGGEQDVYYRPSLFIIANPHLKQEFSKTVLVTDQQVNLPESVEMQADQKGVLLRNDSEWIGLTPMLGRYASLMAENVLTVRSADIMLRILALLSAPNDKTQKSAEIYLAKLEKGELGVIADSAFTDGIKMQSPPSNNGSYLTQFIELQQYYKGSFFNELGLRANYNMKREAIGEGESSLDNDAILPLCDNMLQCRKEDIQKVNDLYGLNISVDFSSAWLRNNIEYSISMASQLAEIGIGNMGAANVDPGLGQDGSGLDQVGAKSEEDGKDGKDGYDEKGDDVDESGDAEEKSSGSDAANGRDAEEDQGAGSGESDSESGEEGVGESDERGRTSQLDDEQGGDGRSGDDRLGGEGEAGEAGKEAQGEDSESQINDVSEPEMNGVVEMVNEMVVKKLEDMADE